MRYFTERTMTVAWVKTIARLISAVVLLVTGLMVMVPSVEAITYDITSDHSTGQTLGTPPFGTVTLVQNGVNVDVTVALSPNYVFAKTGVIKPTDQDFIFNGVGVSLSDIHVGTANPASLTLVAGDAGYTVNPFPSTFTFGISSPGQGNGTSLPQLFGLSFEVDNATIADLTHPTADGQIFWVDIGHIVDGSVVSTGAADVTAPKVPEPASMLLLGLGIVGVVGVRRMLKK